MPAVTALIFKLRAMVARWFLFKSKIPIWVNFGGPYIGICWYISWPFAIFTAIWYMCVIWWLIVWEFGIFSVNLYVVPRKNIWDILRSFSTFLSVLVSCTKKNPCCEHRCRIIWKWESFSGCVVQWSALPPQEQDIVGSNPSRVWGVRNLYYCNPVVFFIWGKINDKVFL
jgi:hypothetical protein